MPSTVASTVMALSSIGLKNAAFQAQALAPPGRPKEIKIMRGEAHEAFSRATDRPRPISATSSAAQRGRQISRKIASSCCLAVQGQRDGLPGPITRKVRGDRVERSLSSGEKTRRICHIHAPAYSPNQWFESFTKIGNERDRTSKRRRCLLRG
jgi:hypothetical protein